jgi:hypothetical protein
MEELVPKPILFNFWKHHMHFLLSEIKNKPSSRETEFLKAQMKKIGNSTTDLYTGNMNIGEISDYCITKLKKIHRYRKDIYLKWLNTNSESYQLIDLPDTSVWILKIGIEKGRHIHIHPGRNVPYTIRVKANILKTAYLTNLFAMTNNISPMDIDLINQLRSEILGLSPIKFVTMNHDLGKIIYLFGHNLGFFE